MSLLIDTQLGSGSEDAGLPQTLLGREKDHQEWKITFQPSDTEAVGETASSEVGGSAGDENLQVDGNEAADGKQMFTL